MITTPTGGTLALAIVNSTTLLVVLSFNAILGRDIGRVSNRVDTAFTPASLAFAIWTPIYILLISTMVAQFYDKRIVDDLSGWFIAQAVFSVAWLVLFTRRAVRASALCLILLTVSVGMCYGRLQHWKTIGSEEWPRVVSSVAFSIYFGWSLLATLLNACIALRLPGALPIWARAVPWGIIFVGVVIVQIYAIDPILALPVGWGAFMRARRGDTVAGVYGALFTIAYVGVQIASIATQ